MPRITLPLYCQTDACSIKIGTYIEMYMYSSYIAFPPHFSPHYTNNKVPQQIFDSVTLKKKVEAIGCCNFLSTKRKKKNRKRELIEGARVINIGAYIFT